jgi:hypothetical protein
MPRFSQRHGYSPLEQAFQRESIDDKLRTYLWNLLKIAIWDSYKWNDDGYSGQSEKSQHIDALMKRLWVHFFNDDLDNLREFKPRYDKEKGAYEHLKKFFFRCKWFEVYDLIEEISNDHSNLLTDEARQAINAILEKQNAAYRFVGKTLAEITNQNEIQAIEEGIAHPETPVRMHLEAALRMLSDRETPDYRNSIKESISAVEAACRLVSGDNAATLGGALKKVKNLHPALSQAFDKMYGYTSDASGIRHSLIDDPNITYADAKFMLVACSAFVSYLKASAAKG